MVARSFVALLLPRVTICPFKHFVNEEERNELLNVDGKMKRRVCVKRGKRERVPKSMRRGRKITTFCSNHNTTLMRKKTAQALRTE